MTEKHSTKNMANFIKCDVLVIGGGIGGWSSAITAKETGRVEDVIIVEKSRSGRTGPSALVGGVFSTVLKEDDTDELLKFYATELSYLLDQDIQELIITRSPDVLKDLEKWGVKFLKKADGSYLTTYQRGQKSTLHLDGGGIPMMDALTGYGKKIGVKSVNWTTATDLIVDDGRVAGAVGINCRTGEFLVFKAKSTVLATGGTLFKTRQPGHRNTTGDGWAMAYRAGVELMGFDLSKSNVYGATLEVGPGNGLMLGQGAILRNNKMEEYAKDYPEMAKLNSPESHAPLMAMEAKRGNAPPVWLDLRHFNQEQVESIYKSVPLAAKRWEKLGFIKNRKFIKLCEYAPEGPRPGGGVFVKRDFSSRNMQGLFACGEAVANFQCGGSLNRAAVSGVIAGKAAAKWAEKTAQIDVNANGVESLKKRALAPLERQMGIDPENALIALQEAIHPYPVSILRNEKALKNALCEVERIRDTVIPYLRAYDPHYLRLVHELGNMALCAEMYLRHALARQESRQGALREDFPHTDNLNWLKWIFVKKDSQQQMKIWTEDIPIDRYKFKPKPEKRLHPFWQRVEELGYWRQSPEE
ncbi:MAG: FAD-binding protein [Desulfobacterales bacterium]|nr:FAD-binding protein [Desulfobacterales bacterium]